MRPFVVISGVLEAFRRLSLGRETASPLQIYICFNIAMHRFGSTRDHLRTSYFGPGSKLLWGRSVCSALLCCLFYVFFFVFRAHKSSQGVFEMFFIFFLRNRANCFLTPNFLRAEFHTNRTI